MESVKNFFSPKSERKCSEGNTKTSEQTGPPKGRSRKWCFTSFRMDKDPLKKCTDIDSVRWLIWAPEICPETMRPHWQCFVYMRNNISYRVLQNTFGGEKFNCRIAGGSLEEQINYIQGPWEKDEKKKPFNPDFKEYGKKPEQGLRQDLDQVRDSIMNGTDVDEICESNPILYHQYGRTLNRLEDIALRRKYRTEMTKGIWYWGRTDIGKSHHAYGDFHPDTHYVLNHRDKGWWDGYKGQETVIINEFRANDVFTYDYFLELCDKWPMTVSRRSREPCPFISKKIVVTSSIHPADIFWRRNEKDSMKQLYRRFEIVELTIRC